MGPRQYTVLRMLAEHNCPVRECELWKEGNKDPLFRKERGAHFWKEDMACLITKMVESELVTRVYLPQHTVFIVITQKGYERLLGKEQPRKLLKLQQEVVKRLVKRMFSYTYKPELEVELVKAVKKLPAAYAEGVLVRLLGAVKGKFDFDVSKYGTEHWTSERLKNLADLCMCLELSSEVIAKIDAVANRKFTKLHEREIGQRATVVRKSLGNCIFCNAEIHNEDAARDEALLKKYVGTKTGMVCCSCFSHLGWVQKHLVTSEVT
jgi:hypothetical protein